MPNSPTTRSPASAAPSIRCSPRWRPPWTGSTNSSTDASHELRTPLTLISTEIELALRRQRSTAELEETLRNVAADADRLTLADTLLTVGMQPPPAPTDVTDLATLAADAAARYPHTHAHHDEAALALGDPTRLRQVLDGSALDNASRHGQPPITITTGSNRGACYLSVHDTGPGMDPASLTQASAQFTRADTAPNHPRHRPRPRRRRFTIITAHHGQLLGYAATAATTTAAPNSPPSCQHPTTGTTITLLLPTAPLPAAAATAPDERG